MMFTVSGHKESRSLWLLGRDPLDEDMQTASHAQYAGPILPYHHRSSGWERLLVLGKYRAGFDIAMRHADEFCRQARQREDSLLMIKRAIT